MDRRRRLGVVILSTVVLLTAPVASGTAAPRTSAGSVDTLDATRDDPAVVSGSPSATAGQIQLTKELSLTPDRPGEISVTYRFSIPDSLTELSIRLPGEASVTSTRGFGDRDGEYVWDERLSNPSITFRLPANETKAATGPIADEGQYQFVDAGDWALVEVPGIGASWRSHGGATLATEVAVDGDGAAGPNIAYLGDVREYTHEAADQSFRLAVPERADLAEDPDDIFESVGDAAASLRVRDRDEDVFMVAAPTTDVEWAVHGIQTGEADFWVRDEERLDRANNVWLHEYVHTRQDYDPATETRWFTEASASYYAALLALEQERIEFDDFRDRIEMGERGSTADAVLSKPGTWEGIAPYTKGALVAGELDREIRLSSDGRSLQHVFRAMNTEDGRVSGADFRAMVRESGDDRVGSLVDEYVTTRSTPSMWSVTDHDRAFDQPLAYFSYRKPTDGTAVAVSGPYRNGSLATADPARIAVGETVSVTAVVTNEGGTAGTVDTRFLVDRDEHANRSVRLAAGESRSLTFEYAPSEPGASVLTIGETQFELTVSELAEPTVAGLTANRTEIPAGEAVALTATLENDAGVPAAGNVTLEADGTAVDTRRVVVEPESETTLSFERTLTTAGPVTFQLGGETTTVTVREPQTTTHPTRASTDSAATDAESSRDAATTAERGDGFGVVPVVLALALLVARRGRRSRE